jgi:hypothetical protein
MECKNQREKLTHKIPNVEEFEPVQEFIDSYIPIKWKQYINERSNIRKKLRNGLKY